MEFDLWVDVHNPPKHRIGKEMESVLMTPRIFCVRFPARETMRGNGSGQVRSGQPALMITGDSPRMTSRYCLAPAEDDGQPRSFKMSFNLRCRVGGASDNIKARRCHPYVSCKQGL